MISILQIVVLRDVGTVLRILSAETASLVLRCDAHWYYLSIINVVSKVLTSVQLKRRKIFFKGALVSDFTGWARLFRRQEMIQKDVSSICKPVDGQW